MKFNAKYNRYVSKDGLIYRLKNGILELCKITRNRYGYLVCLVNGRTIAVHRLVYETFNNEIPEGYEVDHINFERDDNRLCNLQLLTHAENLKKRRPWSEFGRLFKEHYNTTSTDNMYIYQREYSFYKQHNNTCSWQLEEI